MAKTGPLEAVRAVDRSWNGRGRRLVVHDSLRVGWIDSTTGSQQMCCGPTLRPATGVCEQCMADLLRACRPGVLLGGVLGAPTQRAGLHRTAELAGRSRWLVSAPAVAGAPFVRPSPRGLDVLEASLTHLTGGGLSSRSGSGSFGLAVQWPPSSSERGYRDGPEDGGGPRRRPFCGSWVRPAQSRGPASRLCYGSAVNRGSSWFSKDSRIRSAIGCTGTPART